MKNIIYKGVLFLLLLLSHCSNLRVQENEWIPSEYPELKSKIWKVEGKHKYFVDSAMHISQRNEIIKLTKEYIADNLKLINETSYDDSLYVVIARDRDEMKKYFGRRYAGVTIMKNSSVPVNVIYSIYGKGDSPLKHELMHLVSLSKWGETIDNIRLSWLTEGLAILADPDLDNCEARTFEEKYVCFSQTDRLLGAKELCYPPSEYEMPKIKIAYAQSAYIVEYLIQNYGLDKIKQQWQSKMESFEEIFGLSFDELILTINNELNQKYPDPIDLDWEKFNQRTL